MADLLNPDTSKLVRVDKPGIQVVPSPAPLPVSIYRAPLSPDQQTETDVIAQVYRGSLPVIRHAPLPASASAQANAATNSTIVVRQSTTSAEATADDDTIAVNQQTGTSYTVQISDLNKLIELKNASGGTVFLPPVAGTTTVSLNNQSGTSPYLFNSSNTTFDITGFVGTSAATITITGSPINVGDLMLCFVHLSGSPTGGSTATLQDAVNGFWNVAAQTNLPDPGVANDRIILFYVRNTTALAVGATLAVTLVASYTGVGFNPGENVLWNMTGLKGLDQSAAVTGTVGGSLQFSSGGLTALTQAETFVSCAENDNGDLTTGTPIGPWASIIAGSVVGASFRSSVLGPVNDVYNNSTSGHVYGDILAAFLQAQPNDIAQFQNNFFCYIKNNGVGSFTVLSSAQIDEASTPITLATGQGLLCVWNGSAWFTEHFSSGSGANSVTHTGILTSGQLIVGNGGGDIKVGDLSGDATTSGSTAVSVVKVNGASVPASQGFVGTNGSSQIVAASYTPENVANKDAASGYAGLTSATMLKLAEQTTAVDARTSTSEAIADSDRAKLVTFSNTSAVAATIAQAGASSNFVAGWYCDLENLNTGTVTLTPTTSTINGQATLVLEAYEGGRLVSNGSNYIFITGSPTQDTPSDADILTFESATKKWRSKGIGTLGGANASQLRGKNISSSTPTNQQVLKWITADNQYDLVLADGMQHGDSVWPVDSSWAGMRDDFNTYLGTNLLASTNPQTSIGELGWAHFGTQLTTGQIFMGGKPPHMGLYTFHTIATSNGWSGLMLNLRDPIGAGSYFFNMRAMPLLENPGWKMSWVFKFSGDLASSGTNNAAFHKKSFYIGLCGAPMGAMNPGTTNSLTTSPRPDYFMGLRYDTSHTPQSWGLNSVAAASGGTTTYTPNNVTGGGGYTGTTNTYKNCTVIVSGCTNAANNGTFTCTASTSTTITLNNASGVVETAPENAIIRITNINITAVTQNSPASGQCTMTYVNHNTNSPGANGGYIGQSFTGSGFTNAGNNVTATCIGSTSTSIILNISGVTETPTANAAFLAVTDSPNDDGTGTFKFEVVQNGQYTGTSRHNLAGTVSDTSISPAFGNWYRLDLSCTTAGQVVMTLYDENNAVNATHTFTVSQVALSTGSITFATDANKMLSISPSTSSASSGVPTIQCMPFAAGSTVTISGLTGSAGTDFNATWTLEAASDRGGSGNWQGWIYTNNASVSFAGQTGTLTGYAAYAPICVWGDDDSGATGAGTTWPTPNGLTLDFFSLVWNNAITGATTAPNSAKSRYW
jgi:hypothetical protein